MGLPSDGLYWVMVLKQGLREKRPCHIVLSIWQSKNVLLNIDIFLRSSCWHEGQSVNEWRGKECFHAKPPVRQNTGHHARACVCVCQMKHRTSRMCVRACVCVRRTHAYCHSLFRERICGTQCIHQHCQDSCKVFCYFLTPCSCVCVCVCVCVSCLTGLQKHFLSAAISPPLLPVTVISADSVVFEASITTGLLSCSELFLGVAMR